MAEYTENQIKFGWLTKEEMLQAIEDGNLNAYDICFCKDTHEEYLINSSLEPITIRSRVRIYGSVEAAMADVQSTPETYAGEILSIRDGDKFIAYIVNELDGEYFVTPVYADRMIDYNSISNIPIKNLDGDVTSPIVLTNLADGYYKITGHFIIPTGNEVTSIVGNFIFVETPELNVKHIKRINSDSIFDYKVDENGVVTTNKYATEEYVQSQGYSTKDYVDAQIAALDCVSHEELEQYVAETCTLLIKHLIDEELDSRYADEEDITELFN